MENSAMLEFFTASLIALIIYYYVLIVAQLFGIINIVDPEGKLSWKCIIPFYQLFKVFKNEK